MRRFSLGMLTVFLVSPIRADVLLLKSGPQQVGLLELYTSEGCSSCPPADRWLRSLEQRPGLFSEFVPLAFHVDYWDYIGWKDRFADRKFSERQRLYARLGLVATVYTPGFVYNGREWRNFFDWSTGEFPDSVRTGELTMRIDEDTVELTFEPVSADSARYVANVALLGSGLRSEVAAGENRGRELLHSFVVLSHAELPLAAQGTGHSGSMTVPTSNVVAERYALVAWISVGPNPTPLQAVGAYLPDDD
jgi:hypothetical protein